MRIPSSKYGLAPPDLLDERTHSPDLPLPPPPPPDHEVPNQHSLSFISSSSFKYVLKLPVLNILASNISRRVTWSATTPPSLPHQLSDWRRLLQAQLLLQAPPSGPPLPPWRPRGRLAGKGSWGAPAPTSCSPPTRRESSGERRTRAERGRRRVVRKVFHMCLRRTG